MGLVAQRILRARLRRLYVVREGGYFWDSLDSLGSFDLHGRVAWRRLEIAAESAVRLLRGRPPFVLFTDRFAGWREVPSRRRNTPIRVDSLVEALRMIREQSHFRDGTAYEDNYYVADVTLGWFLCFCHHDGWHLWLPAHLAKRPAWRQWRRRTGARWEQPSPSHPDGLRSASAANPALQRTRSARR